MQSKFVFTLDSFHISTPDTSPPCMIATFFNGVFYIRVTVVAYFAVTFNIQNALSMTMAQVVAIYNHFARHILQSIFVYLYIPHVTISYIWKALQQHNRCLYAFSNVCAASGKMLLPIISAPPAITANRQVVVKLQSLDDMFRWRYFNRTFISIYV